MLFPRIYILSFGVVCLFGCRELPEGNGKDGSIAEDASTSCTVLVSPTKQTVDYRGGVGEVEVKAETGCSWTAVAEAGWLTVTKGSGNGPGKVQFRTEPNTGDRRSSSILVNGQTAVVEQAAEGQCSYALSQTSATFGRSAETFTVSVMTPGGCDWKALSATSWIKISDGGSGTGDGDVVFSVAENNTSVKREGGLVIADILFEVTQAGAGCSYEVTPTTETFDAAAASAQVTVTTGDGCPWEATSNDGWLTVTSEATGSGSGTVNYSVDAQDSSLDRVGSLTIAGQTVNVSQSGAGCSYSIDPENSSYDANAGSGTLTVTATEGCSWTAESSDGWVTITSGASGDGDGTVEYSVAANGDTTVRSAEITVAGKTFDISQAGVACSDAISPTSASTSAAAATGSVGVTAPAGCDWTATSNDDWITITAGATGSGGGTVSYSAAANPTSVAREGEILIAGSLFVLTQAGVSCNFAIDPSSAAVDASTSSVAVSVSAAAGCAWTATSSQSWINVTSGASGSGDGTVSLAVSANSASDARSGTVTIAGKSFTVSQAGVACSYQLSSSSAIYTSTGGSGTVGVTAPNGCAWTASSNEAWVSIISGASGSADGTVSYTVQASNNSAERSATLTVAGKSFTVTQSGATCSYELSSDNASYTSAGGNGTVGVTAPSGCTWTASSNEAWVSIASGNSGSGNGTVSYTVQSSTGERGATLTVAGKSFAVTQSGPTEYCGDGVKNGSEACDGSDFGSATCESLSLGAGTLTCGAENTPQECMIDTSGCCPVGQTRCNGQCVDTDTNVNHCGVCFHACSEGCTAGGCNCGLPDPYPPSAFNPPTTAHNGIRTALHSWENDMVVCWEIKCIDGSWIAWPSSSFPNETGPFGMNECSSGGGGCCDFMGAEGWPCCPAEKKACGEKCVDLNTDADNCGACGRACDAGQTCNSGKCSCGVPDGYPDAGNPSLTPDGHTLNAIYTHYATDKFFCLNITCVDGTWVAPEQDLQGCDPDTAYGKCFPPGSYTIYEDVFDPGGCCGTSGCCDFMGAGGWPCP